jgi:hypothetical protein
MSASFLVAENLCNPPSLAEPDTSMGAAADDEEFTAVFRFAPFSIQYILIHYCGGDEHW